MHPSISLSLDPGLECGVPGGRDLYTFVTSAAGHMMRTLQKPRKNRPSKRQVNHRRFLHNMIQRKFADIEAANHRLASALYFKVDEKKPDAAEPAPNPSQLNPAGENAPEISLESKDCLTESRNAPTGRKTHREATSKPKSRKSKLKKTDQNVFDFASPGSAFTEAMDFFGNDYSTNTLFSTDGQINGQTENNFLHFEQGMDSSPSFSPELSPLSLDSCDFSVQMFTDVSSSAQNNSVEMTETQWTDICDLFSKDLRGSANIETYLDSFCDAECSDECEQEDFLNERWPCKFNSDQVLSANHLGHFNSLVTGGHEVDMTNFTLSNNCNVVQNELQFPVSCQSFQDPVCQARCTGRSELNPIPFEGVAQSFSAPSQNVPRFSIPTPPIEGDWPFTDILTDNTTSCN